MIKIAERSKLLLSVLVLSCISLAGCQAAMYGTAADMNRVQIGMSRTEVVGLLGEPMTRGADAATGEERLTYKRMAYTLGWSPALYDVVLREGKVVRFGAQQ